MIQFNLLPSVKQDFIKAQRMKQTMVVLSSLITLIALGCLILLLLIVDVYQKQHLTNLDTQVQNDSSQLTSKPNLNKILTIQNQIKTLPTLEGETPVVSRLFGYLQQLTPLNATISSFSADFTQNTVTLTGAADGLQTVNQFVDTLESATYTVQGTTTSGKLAFSTVVLSSFGYNKGNNNGQAASYTITADFDPTIFSSTGNVTLSIPNEVTTRSVVDQPTDLFVQNVNSGKQ